MTNTRDGAWVFCTGQGLRSDCHPTSTRPRSARGFHRALRHPIDLVFDSGIVRPIPTKYASGQAEMNRPVPLAFGSISERYALHIERGSGADYDRLAVNRRLCRGCGQWWAFQFAQYGKEISRFFACQFQVQGISAQVYSVIPHQNVAGH